MRMTVLAAAAAFAVASGAMTIQASAADLDFMPPPPAFVPTWQGFYIGGHVGYGEADFEGRADVDVFDAQDVFIEGETFRTSLTADGLLGGVQGGFNWQFNSLVFGIEGDVSFTDWDDSTVLFDEPLDGAGITADFGAASVNVDFLASVRGRLGFAANNFLLYGTGGIAWADASADANIVVADSSTVPDTETEWNGSEDFSDIGFVVGAGMGWMVIPQTFSVGLEGLYYFFDQKETLIDDTIAYDTGELDVRATASIDDAWVIRARADFHF